MRSSVNGSVCLVCCVLVNCFSETIHNMFGCGCYFVVVVRLPRPMEGNGVTPIFRSLQNCQLHHRRLESLEHFNVLYIYIYHSEYYGLSFLDLTDAIFFTRSPFFVYISIFASTLCMCVMYLTSI